MKSKAALLILCLALVAWPGQTQSAHGVALSWTPGANDATFNVYRGTVKGGPYTVLQTGLTTPAFEDATGVGGTNYFYVTTGVGLIGGKSVESGFSNEATATFPLVPASPQGLAAAPN